MTRAAYYDFTIGDFTLAQLNIRHLIERVTFVEETGKFDSVTIELQQGPELNKAYPLLKHGSVFQLSMGYHNEMIEPMMLGFLKGVGISCENRTATLNIFGYLGALDRGEKTRVLQDRTIREVVEEIIGDYGPLVVGTIENGDTVISSTVSQSNQTDLKYLEEIARKFGMRWKTEPTEDKGVWAISLYSMANGDESTADNYPTVVFNPGKSQQTRSNYRHLKSFDVESNIMGCSSNVNILSNNPSQPVTVNSEVYDPTIYQTQVSGSAIVYEVFGSVNRIQFYENVTDEEAAQIIADALLREDELQFVATRGAQLAEGDPFFRNGQYRKIILNDVPLFGEVFSGNYLVTKTEHIIGKNESYITKFEANRSALTPPPPPEIPVGVGGGVGGGEGPWYRLYFDSTGLIGGNIIYYDYGVMHIVLGAYLTKEEIMAIPELVAQVNMYYTPAYQFTQNEESFSSIGFMNPYYTPANQVDPDLYYSANNVAVTSSLPTPTIFDPLSQQAYGQNQLTGEYNTVTVDVYGTYATTDSSLYTDVRESPNLSPLQIIQAGGIDDIVDTADERLYEERMQRLEEHEAASYDEEWEYEHAREKAMAGGDSGELLDIMMGN